jgi:hypothetical protein
VQVFEQDWLELGSRVARSLHYQHARNLRSLDRARAEVLDAILDQEEVVPPAKAL